MAAFVNNHLAIFGDGRADIAASHRGFCQSQQAIDLRQRRTQQLQRWDLCGDLHAQFLENLEFQVANLFLGVEDDFFLLLQLRGDKALSAHQRLLANVVRRHGIQVAARDFDVIAKDAIIADLQVLDSGALDLLRAHAIDPSLGVAGDGMQFIQFRMKAIADHAAFANNERRFIDDAAREQVAQTLMRIEFARMALQGGGLRCGERLLDGRDAFQRPSQ